MDCWVKSVSPLISTEVVVDIVIPGTVSVKFGANTIRDPNIVHIPKWQVSSVINRVRVQEPPLNSHHGRQIALICTPHISDSFLEACHPTGPTSADRHLWSWKHRLPNGAEPSSL